MQNDSTETDDSGGLGHIAVGPMSFDQVEVDKKGNLTTLICSTEDESLQVSLYLAKDAEKKLLDELEN